ncbi:patched domain-containing protein 3-like isoform X2 [Ptychodera flava]|uniref:patched domain-containing protein 3-like isoform X2 n=1 Tax=Ptychodera flava TaxID=63121 RepID=UPI003969F62F
MATAKNSESNGNAKPSCLQTCSNAIVTVLESVFYRHGKLVGKYPWITILFSVLVAMGFAIGMLNFVEENRREKLWIPMGSQSIDNLYWVNEYFSNDIRFSQFIIEDRNVLRPAVLQAMLELDKSVKSINASGVDWETVCYKVAGQCLSNSLLELWSFNETVIVNLSTNDILDMINTGNLTSPVYYNQLDIEKLLGGITRDGSDRIISARATIMNFLLEDNREYDPDSGDEVDPNGDAFEEKVLEIGKTEQTNIDSVFVFNIFGFGEESSKSIQGDVSLLSAGYMLIIAYVAIMLGRFTVIEQKFYVAVGGVLCVGLSILVAIGLSSACGFFYGPVHTVLPFLLLGIGVDDMFVIVQAWSNLPEDAKKNPIHERVGQALRHAGVSITVTSITDFVAFGIGASTILPALRSFCVYCAIGIFFLFFFSITFFTAVLAIDQRRVESKRNACCCCYVHQADFPRWRCGQDNKGLLASCFRHGFANGLMKLPVKIVVVIAALALLGVNIWGTINLEQEFQFEWFLPEDSYVIDYLDASDTYFPASGLAGDVYLVDVDYYTEFQALDDLYDQLENNQYIFAIDSWYEDLRVWIRRQKNSDPAYGDNDLPVNETVFFTWALEFLQVTNEGRRHSDDIKLSQDNITYSRINFQFVSLENSAIQIDAMQDIRKIIKNIGFTAEDAAFAYAEVFPTWDANQVIKKELYRNLGLAMAAVFLVTLILIANLWTSLLVFLCVIFTLVDVTGMMHFWGLTIDTVTTINLILAVGLAVDYSAHIGHTFMTLKGTRDRRAKYTLGAIGPAVFNGGFSTFLAFVLLIFSNSYIFKVFFKIFFLVVLFGLFHGLVFLPVMLSWIGPSPYLSAVDTAKEKDEDKMQLDSKEEGVAKAMEGYTNPIHIPRPNQVIVENGEEVLVMKGDGTQILYQSNNSADTSNRRSASPTPVSQQPMPTNKIPTYGRPEIPPPDYDDLPQQGQRSDSFSGQRVPTRTLSAGHSVAQTDVPTVDI